MLVTVRRQSAPSLKQVLGSGWRGSADGRDRQFAALSGKPPFGRLPVAATVKTGPQLFDEAALRLGYRLLALSDLNTPAVSRVCVGAVLRAESDFVGRMRQHRVS